MRASFARITAVVTLAAGLSGCAGHLAYRQGKSEAEKGNWDMAVARLTRALQKDPENIEYKLALENAKIQASRFHRQEAQKHLAASDLDKAFEQLDIATKYDPSNQAFAAERDIVKEKIKKRDEDRQQRANFDSMRQRVDAARAPVPMLSPRSPVPIAINMPDASLQKVLEVLAQLSGVNILYDPDFHDKQVSVKLKGVTFQEALDQLTFVNRLFYKVIDQNTLIIAPENANKRRQYDENLMKTFYLQNADVNEVQNALRIMLQGNTPLRISPNMGLGAVTVTGNADEIALATKIVEAYDKPIGEVMVEIEILDVKRHALKNYGIELANYDGKISFAPFGPPASNVDIRGQVLSSLSLSDFVVNIPSQLLYHFLQTESNVKILASPRLRASAGKQTTLRIGTEVPIPITTFTAQNTGGSSTFAPATSFQYRNVGINMELTPKVNADGDVKFDPMKAEFSLPGTTDDVGGIKIPEFNTRVVSGVLNIHDGETALIGGLIQGQESDTMSGIIGLQSVPLLNRLFTAPSKTKDDSEILISLTPHVVRGPKLRESDIESKYVGTKEIVKVPGAAPPLLGAPEEPTPAPTGTPAPAPPTAPPAPAPTEGAAPAAALPTPAPANGGASAAPPASVAGAPPAAPGAAAPPTGSAPVAPPPGGPVSAEEAPPVAVLFSPPEVAAKNGETATLSVVVLRVKDMVSTDLTLTYDAEALDAIDVDPGSLLTLDGANVTREKSLVGGRVHAHFTRPSGTSGSGAIATVRFRAKKTGPTTVAVESLAIISPGGPQRATLPGPAKITVQ